METIARVLGFIQKLDKIMLTFFVLALATSFQVTPSLDSINWPVIVTLFALITTVNYWQYFGLLERVIVSLSYRFNNTKALQTALIFCSFFSSMIITNDVAIIVLLALFLPLSRRINLDPVPSTILIIVAANLGSALTPLGNPQNMFLYLYSNLTLWQFCSVTAPIVIAGAIILWGLCNTLPNNPLNESIKPSHRFSLVGSLTFFGVFVAILLSLFHLIPIYIILLITLSAAITCNYKQLVEQHYSLLFTFIFAFIFIGNINKWPELTSLLEQTAQTSKHLLISSVLISQVISNVPTAILLGHFTENWHPLILGVNIGGLGTLIASMASLIGYKTLTVHHPNCAKRFVYKFTILNILLAIILLTPYIIYYSYIN